MRRAGSQEHTLFFPEGSVQKPEMRLQKGERVEVALCGCMRFDAPDEGEFGCKAQVPGKLLSLRQLVCRIRVLFRELVCYRMVEQRFGNKTLRNPPL